MGVAILDCGGQYTKVIDRRVRELEIRSDILPVSTPADKLAEYEALIITGGPSSVYEKGAPKPDQKIFSMGKPILGICYGMQLLAQHFKGDVGQLPRKEYAETKVTTIKNPLFSGLSETEQVLMSHGDSVLRVPEGFQQIASSGNIVAAMADDTKKLYGVQFHPEVDLTTNGTRIFRNFLYEISHLEKSHTIDAGITHAVEEIRKKVGDDNVALLISGGVDSSVTAALLVRALEKEQIYAFHVDNGLMRKDESQQVMKDLEPLGLNLQLVNAQEAFLSGTTVIDGKKSEELRFAIDPEEKRHIIGDTFIRVAKNELEKIPGTVYLVQGTLRPDLIESASELVSLTADTIKTHHNDTPLVREWRDQGKVIEPNIDWHKDEVRAVARKLGLPEHLASRHPFPGPGLAVRVLCSDGKPVQSDAEARVQEMAATYGFKGSVLPVKSVGVQGDERSYRNAAVLEGEFSWQQLKEASMEIPKEIHEINRVCYLLDGTIGELEPMTLTDDTLSLLREADAIVNKKFLEYDVTSKLAQAPVILLANKTLVLRPFITNDFMTGRAAVIGEEISLKCLHEIARDVTKLGIEAVLYDLTSKPPGTTEWE